MSLAGAAGFGALFCFAGTAAALAACGALALAAVRLVLLLGDGFPLEGFPPCVLPVGLLPAAGLAVGGCLLCGLPDVGLVLAGALLLGPGGFTDFLGDAGGGLVLLFAAGAAGGALLGLDDWVRRPTVGCEAEMYTNEENLT